MKLKELEKNTRQNFQRIVVLLASIFIISMILESALRVGISLNFLFGMALIAFVNIGALYLTIDKFNYEYKHLKDEGTKIIGNIIGIGDIKEGANINCYIIISFSNKTKRIKNLEYNYAYSILNMLLDGYPVKELKNIPIDIYIKGTKIYADLESVELEKIEGFEEAKKLVEDMQDDLNI